MPEAEYVERRRSSLREAGSLYRDPMRSPEAPHATTVIYLIALLIIAGISITSHVLTGRIIARQQSTALLVNISGRQRMLSQRIARLADEVADRSIDAAAGRAEMLALAGRMATAQRQLLEGDVSIGLPAATSPQLKAVYFGSPIHLQGQVNLYLAHTRAFAAKVTPAADDPDLLAMRSAVSASLPNALDAAVSEYQAASEHDVRHLRHVMSTLTGVMLVVLVLEALLIYRPLFNRLTDAITLLIKASTTDFLTGVLNRRAFLTAAEREMARCGRLGQPISLLMIDIDHFKRINDTYGHPAGDLVIKHFAAVAAANLRVQESLGRIGGEEFAVLMPGTSLNGAMMAAERIRARFASTTAAVTPHAQRILATVSIGVVCASSASVPELLAAGDRLMYRAKKNGRNRVEAGDAFSPAERTAAVADAGARG